MLIFGSEIKKRIRNRLPLLTRDEVDTYFNSIIKILVNRFINGQSTIIDNFGILSRKKSKPRRILNINTGKYQEIISNTVCLRVNPAFLAFFRDYRNRKVIKKKIIEASKDAYNNSEKNLI